MTDGARGGYAYYDTEPQPGVMIELLERDSEARRRRSARLQGDGQLACQAGNEKIASLRDVSAFILDERGSE